MPSVGLDRETGAVLVGLAHVRQSLQVLFSTQLASRLMRRTYGFGGVALLGRSNLTQAELLKFVAAIHIAIELWEPRLDSLRAYYPPADNSVGQAREGHMGLRLRARYYPEALSGDFTSDVVDIDL